MENLFLRKYLGGIPGHTTKTQAEISFNDDTMQIALLSGFKKIKFPIKADDIVEVGLDEHTYRSAGKAVAGAIVGGVLTGGIGLLAGAALGGKRRKEGELTFVVMVEGNVCDVKFEVHKKMQGLYNRITTFISQYKSKKPQEQMVAASEDVTSQLEKLFSLREKGAITEQEYETQKQKILSA
jgi:hypothetical protein